MTHGDFVDITIDVPQGNLSAHGRAGGQKKRRSSVTKHSPHQAALIPGHQVSGLAPPAKGRVRGMSAVKMFEQEYMQTEFSELSKDKSDKSSDGGSSRQESRSGASGTKPGPLPNVVDLWAQVSRLKEEELTMKNKEAESKKEIGVLNSQVRELSLMVGVRNSQLLADHELSETRCRDSIVAAWQTVHLHLAIIMERCEPEDELLGTITDYNATNHGREAVADQLLLEVQRRQVLEKMLAEGEQEKGHTASLLEQLHRAHHELAEERKRVRDLEAKLFQQDHQSAQLGLREAEAQSRLSKAETDMVVMESEMRRLRVEADTMSITVDHKVQEVRHMEDENEGLRDRLRVTKERLADAELGRPDLQAIPRLDGLALRSGSSNASLSPTQSPQSTRLAKAASCFAITGSLSPGTQSPRKQVTVISGVSPRRVNSMVTPRVKRASGSASPPRSARR